MKTISHLLIIILVVGCRSPQKLVDNYEYEKALKVSTKRLKKGKAKWRNVRAFEQSLNALTEADSIHVQALISEGRADVWPEIYDKAVAISNRQHKVSPVLNRLHEDELEPVVHLYPVESLIEEAADKSALYFYAGALEYFERARGGDQQAAREAFGLLERCRYYRPDYKDASALQKEMLDLGTTNVLLYPMADSRDIEFEYHLLEKVLGRKDFPYRQDWKLIHRTSETIEGEPDYLAEFKLYNIYVSADNRRISNCSQTEKVKVGEKTEQEWSERDSVWVSKTVPVFQEVTVNVTTIQQSKSASLRMHLSVVDVASDEELVYKSFYGCETWENRFSIVAGDTRALNAFCSNAGGCEQIFPYGEDMLLQAASDIRGSFYKHLKRAVD